MGQSADVKCPGKSVILEPNQSFTCPVQIAGKTQHVLITLTDKQGNVSWKLTS